MSLRRTPDEIFQRVQLILRRDLKLGAETPIVREMPFFGGEIDLDSLDILLLVTSIEKELGVKIPSDVVGREVFQNVGTLVDYVAQHQDLSSADGIPVPAPAEADPLSRLPHREPFRFVTEITALEPGQSARGIWSVTGAEDFFRGHFPGRPIVPGVLLAEAMAQLSGVAGASAARAQGTGGSLARVDVRFDRPIVPPATIILTSRHISSIDKLHQFEVSATVGAQAAASGTITLHLETGEASS